MHKFTQLVTGRNEVLTVKFMPSSLNLCVWQVATLTVHYSMWMDSTCMEKNYEKEHLQVENLLNKLMCANNFHFLNSQFFLDY